MERIKYRISLDMFEVASQTTIKAKKGDTACAIHITLMENRKVYKIDEGCTAFFSAKKPDGNYLFNNETCRIEDNTIIYDFTKQTTPIEGIVECEVILKKGEDKLTSPRFNIKVGSTVYNGEEIISTPEADALKEFIEESESRVNSIIEESESRVNSIIEESESRVNSIIEESENLIEEIGEVHRNSNQYFSNAIKGTASGTEVTMKDVSPIPHNIGAKLRSGKNLLPYPYYTAEGATRTHRGISFTVNADRSITIHGTNDGTDNSVFYCMLDNPIVLPKGSYIASGVNNYSFVGKTAGGEYPVFSDGITLTEPTEFVSFYFNVPGGAKFENPVVVRPMLEMGTTATEYEPPVDISTVKLYKGGKNLIPYPYHTAEGGIRTHRGISFVVNADRSITINGTNDGTGDSVFYCMLDNPIVLPKGSYIASGVNGYSFVGYTGSAYLLFSSGRTLTEPTEFKSLYFNVPKGASVNNIVVKPMIEMGTTATEYEPPVGYTEYIPNSDGTVNVPSLYPTTRLYTDTDGVTIEAEYNRDTNKVINGLLSRISALEAVTIENI